MAGREKGLGLESCVPDDVPKAQSMMAGGDRQGLRDSSSGRGPRSCPGPGQSWRTVRAEVLL